MLPYLAKIPVAIAMKKMGHYDNHYPRLQASQLKGFGARAQAAHENSFESLIIFATAILTAITTQTTGDKIQYLAITYIISRVIYHIVYLLDLDGVRSLIWTVGLICSLWIMLASFPT